MAPPSWLDEQIEQAYKEGHAPYRKETEGCVKNLTEARLPCGHGVAGLEQLDYSTGAVGGRVLVYFRGFEQKLSDHISRADCVVGCVAWLTGNRVLRALAEKKHGVLIVVQKEDFLRPEIATNGKFAEKLRREYNAIPELTRFALRTEFRRGRPECHDEGFSTGGECELDTGAIRCVGNYNGDNQMVNPRMHNKFLLMCRFVPEYDDDAHEFEGWGRIEPYEVWTGSLNLTQTALRSFENAVVMENPEIVLAYYREFLQILALSEPLNWKRPWVWPQWRIGT